jgi:hypothetical protein
MDYFKIKLINNKYNFYGIENNMLYTQRTYSDFYEMTLNDLFTTNKSFYYIKEYSNKVDFYTENIFDFTLSKLSYNDFLIHIVKIFLRDKKISKLLE